MSRAAHLAFRVALTGCGLLGALVFAFSSPSGATPVGSASPASAATASSTGAGISIVNGRNTTIGQWPWQVGIAYSSRLAPGKSVSQRFFCGGAVLTPRIVITAGHCVADLRRAVIRQLVVVSGRTRLNATRGQVVRVGGLRMPLNEDGKRRYRSSDGTADWDVALLLLKSPLQASPISLAGPGEDNVWKPGRVVWTTGWGITRPLSDRVPTRLKLARQVVMPDGVCRRANGRFYRPATMVCLGGPDGNAATCSGDSGGPMVANSSDGYRLVGLTSFGDSNCRGFIPSVDTRVSGSPIRRWVKGTVNQLTGRNVVGSGGTAGPVPNWCRVPAVLGLRVPQARKKLEAADCRLGRVRTDRFATGRRGHIVGYSRYPGWLATPGYRLNLWIAP